MTITMLLWANWEISLYPRKFHFCFLYQCCRIYHLFCCHAHYIISIDNSPSIHRLHRLESFKYSSINSKYFTISCFHDNYTIAMDNSSSVPESSTSSSSIISPSSSTCSCNSDISATESVSMIWAWVTAIDPSCRLACICSSVISIPSSSENTDNHFH